MSSYPYGALTEPDSIRLIILRPSAVHDAELDCSLIHTTISECDHDLIEPFTALSYVWGNPKQTGQARVDGHLVTITASLEAALRDMRDESRIRRVWADALCINQSDTLEKSQQVSIMGQIYASAHNTIIYLGALTPDAESVLSEALKLHIGPLIRSHHIGMHSRLVTANDSDPDATPREATARTTEGQLRMISEAQRDLLKRPWFRRVWIFQELVFSRDPWVQCGRLRARWASLRKLLLTPDDDPSAVDPNGTWQVFHDICSELSAGRIDRNEDDTDATLLNVLSRRRGLGATDPRDFVFANLSLAADVNKFGHIVEADYSKSKADVFVKVAHYILESNTFTIRPNSWEILLSHLDAIRLSERRGIPSWVPDWTLPSRIQSDGDTEKFIFQQNARQGELVFQNSDSPIPVHIYLEVSTTPVLGLPGMQFEVLRALGPILPRSDIALRGSMHKLEVGISAEDLAFMRGKQQSGSRDLKAFDFHNTIAGFLNGEVAPNPRDRYQGQDEDDMKKLIYLNGLAVTNPVQPGKQSRIRLAVTRRGRLAVVPDEAAKGDVVVYFPNAGPTLVRVLDVKTDENTNGTLEKTLARFRSRKLWIDDWIRPPRATRSWPDIDSTICHSAVLGPCRIFKRGSEGLIPTSSSCQLFALH
jgi:Heterokaryon incompatibility protein (HET)